MTGYVWYLDSETPPLINFSSRETATMGGSSAGKDTNGKQAMWAGDFNSDGRVIYQGPYNDIFFLFSKVLSHPDNTEYLANFIVNGYNRPDFNLDGRSIYQGPGNDRSMLLLHSILANPTNQSFLANFIIMEWLP
jgi:hypothetical protein